MDLYLLRHGAAVDIGAPGVDTDAKRTLSEKGRADMEQAARGLQRLQDHFARILTSPYPRARQTAEIVADTLGLAPALCIWDGLRPGATLEGLIDEMEPPLTDGPVLVVGHNPDLEEMAADALAPGATPMLQLRKGGLAIVRFPGPLPSLGMGRLRCLLTCKHLRMMAP